MRMQADLSKQYLPLLDRPVIAHTLECLCRYPAMRGVMAGIAANDPHWPALVAVGSAHWPKFLGVSAAGDTRADTVLNGLKALVRHAAPQDWVLVHDAVRPCLRHADIDRLIEAVGNGVGGLLALPVSDTVKRADNHGRVLETVARTGLWRAQTPQMFRFDALIAALERALAAGLEITDEASAIEMNGGHPRVVEGRADNIKITLPGDLALAELFMKRQQQEQQQA